MASVTSGILKISMMFRRENDRHNGHRERERAHSGVTDHDDIYARVAASGCRDGVVATSSDVIPTSYPYLGSPLAGRPPRPRRSSSSVSPISLSLALSRQSLKICIKVRIRASCIPLDWNADYYGADRKFFNCRARDQPYCIGWKFDETLFIRNAIAINSAGAKAGGNCITKKIIRISIMRFLYSIN
jgi:hypothetical protein